MTKSSDIAKLLETAAALGTPITYTDVVSAFPELPPLTGNWRAHPLCSLFGALDDEDNASGSPFRTSIVVTKEYGQPGQGYFDTLDKYRETQTEKSVQLAVWLPEFERLIARHKVE